DRHLDVADADIAAPRVVARLAARERPGQSPAHLDRVDLDLAVLHVASLEGAERYAVAGASSEVQREQRRAAAAITLRHSGHSRPTGRPSAGAGRALAALTGFTTRKNTVAAWTGMRSGRSGSCRTGTRCR